MKIITMGILVFICWASFSTFVYVCKIKGLCNEGKIVFVDTFKVDDALDSDSLSETATFMPLKPDSLVIYFAFDKAEFVSDSAISDYYEKSNSYILQNSTSKLLITGHADSKGSDEYNYSLGYRRAQSVMTYLQNRGISAERIEVETKGEKDPQESNNTDEGRTRNRRATVIIKN